MKMSTKKENIADTLIGDFNPSELESVAGIKGAAKDFIGTIVYFCPEGRRRSIALTHIEEAAMMAVKSLFEEK